VEQDFPKSQFAHHSVELLGATEGPPKLPKHYHVAQYVLVCLRALWRMYVGFVVDIDIKIFGGGFSYTLVCWCHISLGSILAGVITTTWCLQ
jgi:hypothetical protein